MEGFIVFDHVKQYATARKQLAQWLAEGKIKRQETIVKGGLQVVEQALVDLFKGGNTGWYHHVCFRLHFAQIADDGTQENCSSKLSLPKQRAGASCEVAG